MFKFLSRLFGSSSAAEAPVVSGAAGVGGLKEFVAFAVKSLVDYPDEVQLQVVDRGDSQVIQISCRQSDIGKIVGKRGRTIMAIRSLVSGAAGRQHLRVSVDVMDDDTPQD